MHLQIKYRIKPGAAAERSEEEESSTEEECQQGSELSEDDEDEGKELSEKTNQKPSFESNNPFALLGEDWYFVSWFYD